MYSNLSLLYFLGFTLTVQATSVTTPILASGSAFALQPNSAKSIAPTTVTSLGFPTPLFDAPTTTVLRLVL
ncbi:hypothetical protein BKA64DRAFT_659723 [Cadophora sp. MPI-SDFR-AT-0126]|nr:hypothetical protein BKA64DRAFT_659723 [Leotiomycetes sp. MPI-SDFR-AT-0126]